MALRYEAEDPIESLDSILRSCRATEDLRRRARLSGGANLKELVQIDLLRKVAGDILIRRVLGSRHRSAPVRSCIVAALGPHHRPNLRRCQMAIPDRFKQRLMCRCARQSCKPSIPPHGQVPAGVRPVRHRAAAKGLDPERPEPQRRVRQCVEFRGSRSRKADLYIEVFLRILQIEFLGDGYAVIAEDRRLRRVAENSATQSATAPERPWRRRSLRTACATSSPAPVRSIKSVGSTVTQRRRSSPL